jgi:hypothetical protein
MVPSQDTAVEHQYPSTKIIKKFVDTFGGRPAILIHVETLWGVAKW